MPLIAQEWRRGELRRSEEVYDGTYRLAIAASSSGALERAVSRARERLYECDRGDFAGGKATRPSEHSAVIFVSPTNPGQPWGGIADAIGVGDGLFGVNAVEASLVPVGTDSCGPGIIDIIGDRIGEGADAVDEAASTYIAFIKYGPWIALGLVAAAAAYIVWDNSPGLRRLGGR